MHSKKDIQALINTFIFRGWDKESVLVNYVKVLIIQNVTVKLQ